MGILCLPSQSPASSQYHLARRSELFPLGHHFMKELHDRVALKAFMLSTPSV